MIYVRRNEAGEITKLTRRAVDDAAEKLAVDDPEVVSFLEAAFQEPEGVFLLPQVEALARVVARSLRLDPETFVESVKTEVSS